MAQGVDCVHAVFKKLFLSPKNKEIALNWISSLLQLNEARTDLNSRDPLSYEMRLMVLSEDGFLINLSHVLLKFCDPFLDKPDKFNMISEFFFEHNKRLNFKRNKKLNTVSFKALESNDNFHFIPEIFFLTAYALHVSILPAFLSYEAYFSDFNRTQTQIDHFKKIYGDAWINAPNAKLIAGNNPWSCPFLTFPFFKTVSTDKADKLCDILDGFDTHLMNPAIISLQTRFTTTLMKWFLYIEKKYQGNHGIFSTFPEWIVRLCCDFLNNFMR